MQRIKIRRLGDRVGFAPDALAVDAGAADGGKFVFENDDTRQAHQPQPQDGAVWCEHPISPGGSSDAIKLKGTGVYPYACKLHPEEVGVVQVPAVIRISTQPPSGAFHPAHQMLELMRNAGIVMFRNMDGTVEHLPEPADPSERAWFQSTVQPGQCSPVLTFTRPGRYEYMCALHPNEKGTILVVSNESSPSVPQAGSGRSDAV
ncbi:MAG: hypothetical protein HY820_20025 [Acidobacteria bacterium]|nr:hypothetical protein [Acidobacteriota bacterium]